MHGSGMGSLNVYVKNTAELTSPTWSRHGTQGDRWWRGYIDIVRAEKYEVDILTVVRNVRVE